MQKNPYTDFIIPDFKEYPLAENEIIECKVIYECMANLLRERIGIFQIHMAYFIICELKQEIINSMKENLKLIEEEIKIRKINYEKDGNETR